MTSSDRQIAGLVGGRYEVTGLIASGGMGSVYRAYDTVLERPVALKVLHDATDPSFVARLRSEATNAARLSHPAIVHVYDFGFDDDAPYIAMELVEGQTLRDILVERTVLRPDLAARVAGQVAGALEHARRAGIIHRDVKPENILITRDGRVKVTDFGLSHALAATAATEGPLFGTAHYLAPEQVRGGDVDHRADVYSLGVVLYEMLVGRTPFDGDSPASIALARLSADVPSPLAADPSVPRALDAVVLRATAREPDDRFPTAGAMADAIRPDAGANTEDLGGLVHHTAVVSLDAEPTIAIPRAGARTDTRRRKRRTLGVVVGVVVLSLLGGSMVIANRLATVAVPSLRGMTQDAARSALEAKGLHVDVSVANDPSVPSGQVIGQVPAAAAKVRPGSTVRITVSIGPEQIGLPDVRSQLFADAERALTAKGFVVKRVDAYDATVGRLRVISQSPDPGVLVEKGAPVTLTVSKGPEKIRVPNVVGDPEATATSDLESAGFVVKREHKQDDAVPKGKVISQDPASGATASRGSTVTIVVSDGPPPVKVPNLCGMSRNKAQSALEHAGLKGDFSGSGNKVADQYPAAGEQVPRGSTVDVLMGFHSC